MAPKNAAAGGTTVREGSAKGNKGNKGAKGAPKGGNKGK